MDKKKNEIKIRVGRLKMPKDLQKERAKFKCEVCDENNAEAIIYYSKYYNDRATIEFPALVCWRCGVGLMGWRGYRPDEFHCPADKIPECYKIMRGGNETLLILPIKVFTRISIKQVIKRYLSLGGYEYNALATPEWRKKVLRLRYLYLPGQRGEKDGRK